MKIIDKVADLQRELSGSSSVGFVPTMGALHEGHLALVRRARAECSTVVVSVFVNPTQFNDPNDLDRYPRQESADCALLQSEGVDYVFVPSVSEIYPQPDTRQFNFGTIEATMEGVSRIGHFNGVAQVVSRLFDIVQPQRSYFGEKDFQQVAIIRAMVSQLSIPVEIVVVPIVRECDGLALSSRNALLSVEHRASSPMIYKALSRAVAMRATNSPAEVASEVVAMVEGSGNLSVIYFEMVDSSTMVPISSWDQSESIQGCIAVQAGTVRLIDNIKLK